MIQRIQSVYLLLTIILSVLFLSGKIMLFVNDKSEILALKVIGFSQENNPGEIIAETYPLTGILFISVAASLAAFASWKNRKLQSKLTQILISAEAAAIILMLYYAYYFSRSLGYQYKFSIFSLIPLAVIILSVLAVAAIRKDEELVKSYDRLR